MVSSFIFLLLISNVTAQQLISLSSLKGGNVPNYLKNEEACGLYVSANSDDDAILANITVTSDDVTRTLLDQKYRTISITSGFLLPYPIQPNATFTTNLDTEKLARLQGVLYYTTAKQLQSNLFFVYNVNQDEYFNIKGTENHTVVFLNTNPNWSTKISNWEQDRDAMVYIYQGIPQDSIEPINTHLFSNPMHSNGFDGFFENVEPFSMSNVAFYMKVWSRCSFTFGPGKVFLDGTTTTAYTTTGFYQKPLGEIDTMTKINTMRDIKSLGLIGANILGHVPNGGSVTFLVEDGENVYGQSTIPTDFFAPWSTPNVGNDIVINSTNSQNGQYYVQYCVVQGPGPNTSEAPSSSTTSTSEASTSSVTDSSAAPSSTVTEISATKTSAPTRHSPTSTTTIKSIETTTKLSVSKSPILMVIAFIVMVF